MHEGYFYDSLISVASKFGKKEVVSIAGDFNKHVVVQMIVRTSMDDIGLQKGLWKNILGLRIHCHKKAESDLSKRRWEMRD